MAQTRAWGQVQTLSLPSVNVNPHERGTNSQGRAPCWTPSSSGETRPGWGSHSCAQQVWWEAVLAEGCLLPAGPVSQKVNSGRRKRPGTATPSAALPWPPGGHTHGQDAGGPQGTTCSL